MKIESFEFTGQGMQRIYENEKWMVGIKNWKPANDISGIDMLERHNKTDELFVLLSGKCTLLMANETQQGLDIGYVEMQPMKVYSIPATLWHNTVTQKDTKLILIEASDTGEANSDVYNLSAEEIEHIRSFF